METITLPKIIAKTGKQFNMCKCIYKVYLKKKKHTQVVNLQAFKKNASLLSYSIQMMQIAILHYCKA